MSHRKSEEIADILRIAEERYGHYFNHDQLARLVTDAYEEATNLDKDNNLSALAKLAPRIKVVWVLSGNGDYYEPITDMPGDLPFSHIKWAWGSDRRRVDFALGVVKTVAKDTGNMPYLIYNGTNRQNDVLKNAAQNELAWIRDGLFIINADIGKTIDQIKSFRLPDNLKLAQDDIIVIVSYAPHLIRLLRLYKHLEPIEGIKFLTIPVPMPKDGEREITKNEILGMIGYRANGKGGSDSYPYVTLSKGN